MNPLPQNQKKKNLIEQNEVTYYFMKIVICDENVVFVIHGGNLVNFFTVSKVYKITNFFYFFLLVKIKKKNPKDN